MSTVVLRGTRGTYTLKSPIVVTITSPGRLLKRNPQLAAYLRSIKPLSKRAVDRLKKAIASGRQLG